MEKKRRKNGKKEKGKRGRARAGGDRGPGRPRAASVTRAWATGGRARTALAAKRRSGARGREKRREVRGDDRDGR